MTGQTVVGLAAAGFVALLVGIVLVFVATRRSDDDDAELAEVRSSREQ